jgi:hypothetical protein
MAKLRLDVVHVTTNFEWIFRWIAFPFGMVRRFSFETTDIGSRRVASRANGTGVAVGFSFEVVEGLPDNGVGGVDDRLRCDGWAADGP